MIKNPRSAVVRTEEVVERPFPTWPECTRLIGVLACGHRQTIYHSKPFPDWRIPKRMACPECGATKRKTRLTMKPKLPDPDHDISHPSTNQEAVMRERITELEELLQSACSISERKGAGTAWDRFLASALKLGINGITARSYRVLPYDPT